MNKLNLRILGLLFAAVLSITCLSANGQTERMNPPSSTKPDLREFLTKHSALPPLGEFGITPVETPAEHERRVIREMHGKGFYRRGIADPGSKEINGQTETVHFTFIDTANIVKPGAIPDPVGLPVSSTAVIIATIHDGKAFVSEDRTFVYSDYETQVDEVLKADPEKSIAAGDVVTASALGGSIRFPSGHITHFVIHNEGYPAVGTQYLFFLHRIDPKSDVYGIVNAYSIEKDIVHPLDDGSDASKFDGMTAAEFISTVQSAILAAASP